MRRCQGATKFCLARKTMEDRFVTEAEAVDGEADSRFLGYHPVNVEPPIVTIPELSQCLDDRLKEAVPADMANDHEVVAAGGRVVAPGKVGFGGVRQIEVDAGAATVLTDFFVGRATMNDHTGRPVGENLVERKTFIDRLNILASDRATKLLDSRRAEL